MQSQSPTPLEALRGHSHAVVFAPRDGGLWTSVGPTIEDAGIEFEVIDHPLLCMSALCWREFNARRPGSRESTAFVALDVDDIEQLAPLFAAIRSRLPHVSAWVIASNVAIRVIEGKPRLEASPSGDATPHADARTRAARAEFEAKNPVPRRTPPQLRIARTSTSDGPSERTSEQILNDPRDTDLEQIEEILLARGASRPRDASLRRSRGDVEGSDAEGPNAEARDAESDDAEERDAQEPSATRLTSDEIAMLMGDLDDDRPTQRRGSDDSDERPSR